MAKKTDGGDALQLGLVQLQQSMVASGERAVIVLEGRDAAGKDGTIKAVTEHLSVRNTRVVALPKPNDRERTQWYFQRYVDHLPAAGELVIFNRSWYNRAGVEVVNGFSTPEEQARFLKDVPGFERMLVESGIRLVKLWLDISKDEHAARLKERETDPLKALKRSSLVARRSTRSPRTSGTNIPRRATPCSLRRTATPRHGRACGRTGRRRRTRP